VLTLALSLAACSREPREDNPGDPVEVRFSGDVAELATRAANQRAAAPRTANSRTAAASTAATRTNADGTQWLAGDTVGIFMIKGNSINAEYGTTLFANKPYTASAGASASFTPKDGTPLYYPSDGASVGFAAYYPYTDKMKQPAPSSRDDYEFTFSLADQSNLAAIDLLGAWTATGTYSRKSAEPVKLQFEHLLTKLVFNIRNGTWGELPVENGMTVAISSVPITFRQYIRKSFGGVPTDNGVLKATAAKGATTVEMIVRPTGIEDLKKVMLTFTNAAGKEFTLSVPPSTPMWERGKKYIYEVTLNAAEKGSTITSTISDWEDEAEVEVEAGIEGELRNARITWSSSKSRYMLTVDPANGGLLFRFGSVVGIFSGNHRVATLPEGDNHDQFDPDDVAWTPTPGRITDWTSIPLYDGKTDYPKPVTATVTVTVTDGYHTVTKVKAGKGDPCRLVGLDLAKIKNTPAGSLKQTDIDNGTWRLPTDAENLSFTGHTSPVNPSAHLYTLRGVPGAMFPDNAGGNLDRFLPIGGYRDTRENTTYPTTDGEVNYNSWTHYWTSQPRSAVDAICMGYNRTELHPSTWGYYTYGFPVRCVRQ